MRTSKPVALLIGILTVLPVIYLFVFMASVMTSVVLRDGKAPPIFGHFAVLMVLHLGTMLVMIGLSIYYVLHVVKNPSLVGDKRMMWLLLVLLGGFIAAPVYWFIYIWRTPDGELQESGK